MPQTYDKEKSRLATERYALKKGFSTVGEYYTWRYLKHKERYNAQSRQWAKDNPLMMKASSLNTRASRRGHHKHSLTTKQLAEWLDIHSNDTCFFCGCEAPEVDHIMPLSRGGHHCLDNLRKLCKTCNEAKRAQTDEEFLTWLRKVGNFLFRIESHCP